MPDQQEHQLEPKQDREDNLVRREEGDRDDVKEKVSEKDDQFTAGNQTPEIATNDGSVIETLDTALHGIPGWSEGENISGSNRADYYEARSYGKSDSEEEMEELKKRKDANES